jgi:hypothetical protein
MHMSTGSKGARRRFPAELVSVWALLAYVTLAVLVTYSRVPAEDLYHVSGSGLAGGASRAVVLLNFPLGLVAIPIVLFLLPFLESRAARVAALVSIVLSAAVFWPGVVTETDLDVRPVNAISALGVLTAAVLTVLAARGRRVAWAPRQLGDGVRIGITVLALTLGLPWVAADLGIGFAGVPVLGTLFQTSELRSQPDVPGLHPAVHHGHHHGMDGVLLVLCALLLSRLVLSVSWRPLRLGLGAYLALMFCYGAGNVANDFWLEQVVKRGWTEWQIPNVTTPHVSAAWGLIVVAAALLWGAAVWLGRRRPRKAYPVLGEAEA